MTLSFSIGKIMKLASDWCAGYLLPASRTTRVATAKTGQDEAGPA
jgi:hypothetical protein